MTRLTDKQIKDRAYYAANAEKIKKQKRDNYNKSTRKTNNPTNNAVRRIIQKRVSVSLVPDAFSEINKKEHSVSAREKIENLRIERELKASIDLLNDY
jgi:hypothetical protein